MKANLSRASGNVEQLHENQEELASVYHIGERKDTISCVPSANTIVDRTPISAKTVGKMVADGMALAIKELRRELIPGSNKGKRSPGDKKSPRDKVWKQRKHWCYTCGTNVSHDSRGHADDLIPVTHLVIPFQYSPYDGEIISSSSSDMMSRQSGSSSWYKEAVFPT